MMSLERRLKSVEGPSKVGVVGWWKVGASLGCQGCSSLVIGERARALKSFTQGTEVLSFSFREDSSEGW